MSTIPHRQLTVVVGLIERDDYFLIIQRKDLKNPEWHLRWEFPGGKIEPNETPLEALHREVLEETALTIHSASLLGVYTQHWNTQTSIQQTFILLYHCKANPGEIHLIPEKNDAYEWEKLDNLLKRKDLLDGNVEMLEELF